MMKAHHTSIPEEHLLIAFKERSRSSFDRVYEQLYPSLYNYGYRLCKNEELVKDCIQNVFIEIWQNPERLEGIHALRYYLLKILRRKIFADLKKSMQSENRLRAAVLTHGDFFLRFRVEELEKEHEIPGCIVQKLTRAVNQLTARQKEAVLLKFYENLTYAEISAVMELKDAKYARQLVYRALDELRDSLAIEQGISHYGMLFYQLMSLELLNAVS